MSDIKPYVYNTKDYWMLKNAVQSRLFQSTVTDKLADPQVMKDAIRKLLERNGGEDKLRMLLQNSIYNYKTDVNVIDPELRTRFADTCKKWRDYQAALLQNFYSEALSEIKRMKKAKESHLNPLPVKIYDWDDMIGFFSKFKAREDDKLVRLQLLYFQIPSMRTIKTMFKELNIEKFDHIGYKDEEIYADKEANCEEVISEKGGAFDFMNCFKFGIPAGIRYKFLHKYAESDFYTRPAKVPSSEQLSEQEGELMRFFFKNDALFVCNETSFFAFDETLIDFAGRLTSERDILFDVNEQPQENIFSGRLPSKIIPIKGFLRYVGLLTFFNKKKDKVYSIIKYLIFQHVSKLFDIRTSNNENIIGLSMIFERIFLKAMNQLYLHLRSMDIYPVDKAGGWMVSIFVGVLGVDQVFMLIDRLVGYNTTLLLPVLALSIFKCYEKQLLAIKTKAEYEDVFTRIKDLNVLATVNLFLFDNK